MSPIVGTQVSQTTYTYDANAVVASGATTGLVSPPGARGNISSITHWLSGGTSPKTTYLYFDTGQVKSMTDACGNTACADMTGTDPRLPVTRCFGVCPRTAQVFPSSAVSEMLASSLQ